MDILIKLPYYFLLCLWYVFNTFLEYKNIIQWLHNKKGCVDVSDVNNFLSLNIDAFNKELENSLLLKTRYRLEFRKDIYVDLNSWLWRNYYKEMHDIYY